LFGGSYEAPKGRDFPIHSHKRWEWVYYRSGFIHCLHGGEHLEMRPGTLWLTPPGVPHAEIARDAYSNYYFEVDGPIDEIMPKVIQDDSEASIGRLLSLLIRELRGKSSSHEPMMEFLTGALLLHVQRLSETPATTARRLLVRDAESLWENQPQLSVEKVARGLGMSISGFRQLIHEERNQSPVAFRVQLRVQRAIRTLQTSTMKLEAVAGMCGFHSASHLSRQIKAATGKSPGSLRICKASCVRRRGLNGRTSPNNPAAAFFSQ